MTVVYAMDSESSSSASWHDYLGLNSVSGTQQLRMCRFLGNSILQYIFHAF